MVERFHVGIGGPIGFGAMLPQQITVKEGKKWTLKVRFEAGRLLFYVQDEDDEHSYGELTDMYLEPFEWDRLLKWVEWQRAEQEVQRRTGRYSG